jgi:hypothetical protein
MMPKYTGQCLCGAVRYEVNGKLDDPHACHCGQCRRQSGHFVAGAGAQREDFRLMSGDTLKWYDSSPFAKRGFCSECGTALFWDGGEYGLGINMGSLDQPTGLRLERHIFVEDKADYYEITDGLPQYEGIDRKVR